ncbi:hypothetical protein T484DRAFT_1881925 [Baffinella frigidus]|nr:hypothetical protein T484DRAFT_1881925 [Cryptophyta sp. CCMP2293]
MGVVVGAVVVAEQTKEEKKKEAAKNKKNVSRIWNMHEGDKFYFFVGSLGAFLVGGANPAVGLIMVKTIKVLFLVDPVECRNQAILWCIPLFAVSIGQMVGDTMRGWGFGKPGEKLTVKVRMLFYNALVRQEVQTLNPKP